MTSRAEVAAGLHCHLCEHGRHGYTQGTGRWGDGEGACVVEIGGASYAVRQGDRDCSSSVVECWRVALEGTPYEGALDGATYTGNMRSVFVSSGLFDWHPMGDGYVAKRGDVYLNERDHTAMCQSAVPDMLSEFLSNEHGGIVGGQVGDQTGRESLVRPYYDYPWDGILAYNGKADNDNDEEENDMTPEQARMLSDIHNRVTRTDTQGHDTPDGHDMLGRINMIQDDVADIHDRVTRTDTQGHDNPQGHDMLGRVNIIETQVREIGVKLDALLVAVSE